MSATSSQSTSTSRRTPTQPRWPTYAGTKNRSGSWRTSSPCTPGGAGHQIASRPSPWWLSRNIASVLWSRTKNAGDPWLGRSLVSGRARQIARTRFSASAFSSSALSSSALMLVSLALAGSECHTGYVHSFASLEAGTQAPPRRSVRWSTEAVRRVREDCPMGKRGDRRRRERQLARDPAGRRGPVFTADLVDGVIDAALSSWISRDVRGLDNALTVLAAGPSGVDGPAAVDRALGRRLVDPVCHAGGRGRPPPR